MRREKLREWLKRYGLPECIGLVFALIFSKLSMMLFGNIILSGFIGTWADNLGFYVSGHHQFLIGGVLSTLKIGGVSEANMPLVYD